jgi:hypothetical protein
VQARLPSPCKNYRCFFHGKSLVIRENCMKIQFKLFSSYEMILFVVSLKRRWRKSFHFFSHDFWLIPYLLVTLLLSYILCSLPEANSLGGPSPGGGSFWWDKHWGIHSLSLSHVQRISGTCVQLALETVQGKEYTGGRTGVLMHQVVHLSLSWNQTRLSLSFTIQAKKVNTVCIWGCHSL